MERKFLFAFLAASPGTRLLPVIVAFLLILSVHPLAFGQSSGFAPQTPSGDQAPSSASGQAADNVQRPATDSEKPRMSVNPITGLVTASGSSYRPLTGRERWKIYWKQNYLSFGGYFGPVFTALVLDQATGSPEEWGGGLDGYGRRLASRAASAIIQGTFQAPVAALLHEDVRYISTPVPAGKRRALHAIEYSLLTYNSHGHPTLNVANLSAYYVSTAISTTWVPGHYSVAGYTLSGGTEQIALSMPINLLQEFWPEVTRAAFRPSATAAATPSISKHPQEQSCTRSRTLSACSI